jgi:hypothetical protein
MIEPTTVYIGVGGDEEFSIPTAWHILEDISIAHFSEAIDLDRLAAAERTISEWPLEIRQAYADALIEATALFHRNFLADLS